MKRINFLGLLVLVSLILVLSCKKDESTPVIVLSTWEKETQMLTATSWEISSHEVYDAPVTIQECEKDDIYAFTADGIYSHNIGTLICGSETNSSGTWALAADGKSLTYDGTQVAIYISKSQLVLTQSDFDGNINQLTFTPM